MPVDPRLAVVIKHIESDNNMDAMRFESGTFRACQNGNYRPSVTNAQKANNCSLTTSHMICATSWGQYQIMGFNIYADKSGFSGNIMGFMKSLERQDDMYARFLETNGLEDFSLDLILATQERLTQFITKYNGPGAIDEYSRRLILTARRLGFATA